MGGDIGIAGVYGKTRSAVVSHTFLDAFAFLWCHISSLVDLNPQTVEKFQTIVCCTAKLKDAGGAISISRAFAIAEGVQFDGSF